MYLKRLIADVVITVYKNLQRTISLPLKIYATPNCSYKHINYNLHKKAQIKKTCGCE